MNIKIVSVREADGGGAVILGVEICAGEGKSERRELMLTAAQYREHRPHRGDELSPEEFDELEVLSETAQAARRGAGILSYGANSRSTLRRKLISKGFSREASDAAVEMLDGAGLIDEKNAARREAERCAVQCRGRKYINARLFSLGVEELGLFIAQYCFDAENKVYDILSIEISGMMTAKIILAVIVVILNYIFSKLFIFKKNRA